MQDLLPNALTQFQEMPSTRRHIYFYTLLFLSASLLSNLWKSVNADESSPKEDIVRIQRVAEIAKP